MEAMMTREYIELPCKQQLFALGAKCIRVDGDKPILESRNILFDALRRRGCLIHLTLQLLDMTRVLLQSMCNLLLEIVDDHKVREERQYIFNLQQISVFQKLHRPINQKEINLLSFQIKTNTYALISFLSCTTYFAIFNHSFFLST